MTDKQLVKKTNAAKEQANKPDEKWYYKITDNKTAESVYVSATWPVKPEKLLFILGFDENRIIRR